ncbi:PucR family transcriptional regulator ligand-binding domain-containing protein [Sporosarcina sp. FSL K6-1522]|uniref:PucR family transcriptional regulator n=1 Tax=Sporosarcina sp. FSL K6-1522 TaxID=2921554 RepID=UPI00315A6806
MKKFENCRSSKKRNGGGDMYLTVEKALKMPVLNQVEVIAGERGLNRVINSVCIMDHPDTSWIKRGELLLTTGYVFKDDEQAQITMIRELSKKGCAGLAIKVKRFLSVFPSEMIQEANRCGLPLLEIPDETPLSDLLFLFTHEIVNKENVKNKQNLNLKVFNDILNGENTDLEDVNHQMEELGFGCTSPYIILVIKERKPEGQVPVHICLQTLLEDMDKSEKQNLRFWCIHFEGPVILFQGKRMESANRLILQVERIVSVLAESISKEYPSSIFEIGLSKVKIGVFKMREGLEEAKKAILLGSKIDPYKTRMVFDYGRFEVDDLINQIHQDVLSKYVESTLHPIIEYDRKNEGELLKTLETFLSSRGKLEDTARLLFVHRNTVKFRLSRIEELLKVDLKAEDIPFNLLFSIKAAKLL